MAALFQMFKKLAKDTQEKAIKAPNMICYLAFDYALYEKREMDKIQNLLKQGEFQGREKRKMEELADWHFQNCMRVIQEEKLPKPVLDWIYGHRKSEPTMTEIRAWYAERRKYFKKQDDRRKKIALIFIFLIAALTLFVKCAFSL